MTFIHKKISCIILFPILFSCSTNQNKSAKENLSLNELTWLIGNWESIDGDSKTVESWQKLNDSTFTGISFYVKNNDTTLLERIVIEQRNENLYYIPTVMKQNEGKAVKFKIKHQTNSKIIFENPEHDFPQRICYTKINNDSLVAEISGISNSEEKSVQFSMKRR